MYKYKLSTTNKNSADYGNCEVCGKHCTEVFHQTEERQYTIERDNTIIHEGYTQNQCKNLFGHKECLESLRRL